MTSSQLSSLWRRSLSRAALALAAIVTAAPAAAQTSTPVQFPAASDYIEALDDPTDDCNNARLDYRDIDKVYIYDDKANQRIFVKYLMQGNAGWPRGGKGIYKWAVDTAGETASYSSGSGTHFDNAEYVLYVWDNGFEDEIGEMNLSYVGLDQSDKDAVHLQTPAIIGPNTDCGNDCVGTLTDTNGNGDADLGEPQIANNNPDIGYRLSARQVEMYVSYSAIGVNGVSELCLVGVGESTATNYNLDQASSCDNTKDATGTDAEGGVFCGSAPGTLTIVKDTFPDYAPAEFRFEVQGNTPKTDLLQDPGMSECDNALHAQWGACGVVPPWDHEDRVSHTDLIASNHPFQERNPYRVIESAAGGATLDAYETTWTCRNVDPVACSPAVAASVDDPFTLAACAPVEPPARCEAEGWTGGDIVGELSGDGVVTDSFDVCMAGHVVCKFTNTSQECPVIETTIGDLHALGGVENEPVGFATAAVPLRTGDAADSIFLASFIPLSEGSRWPGDLDHYIQPLPVKENDMGQLVADTSVVCADGEDTGCLAWRAGTQILGQAPVAAEVTTDRRIGLDETDRRVTYTTDLGVGVPRTIRPFDWSDSDPSEIEQDLWNGFGFDPDLDEADARSLARSIINETLQIHEATIVHPDLPTGSMDLDFVTGDFFHSDPVVVGAPANFFYLANDLEGNGADCDDTTDPNVGYRCFFEKNQRRRRVIVAAANDGQLHGFDAGQFHGDVVRQRLDGEFTYGTGKEVFAHITRPMLAHTRAMFGPEHHFGVDGGLVVDDVFIDAAHNGAPESNQREWRTVIFGTYRDGQRGVFALDVTQPDPVEKLNVLNFAGQPDTTWIPDESAGVVPACAALGGSPGSGCGTLSYPAQLWEFDDTCVVVGSTGDQSLSACDEDANGKADLGFSWSQVNTGRILVNVQGEEDPVVRFVAFFGGGLDSDDKVNVGNWIYMVDIETGKAIYKRPVASAVPSEPAAVDTDQNGIVDTLYFGTAGGLLYKVDISTPADVNPATGRIDTASQWSPFPIFDTGGRAIFYPPTVTFVASQSKYALAFGTGDREDLFSPALAGQEGRFYMILEPGFQPGIGVLSGGPLTEASFQQIGAFSPGLTGDLLTAPLTGNQPGWVLHLAANERVVTKALLLSGLLVFSTFNPLSPDVCEFSGNGSVYALLATNANSIAGPEEDRAITVDGFAGRAVITPTGMTTTGANGEEIDPFAAARIQGIRDNLQDLMPADCRFGNFSLNVSVTMSNTSVMSVASVPVCIARKNWTEQF